jgi:hypothetical protein
MIRVMMMIMRVSLEVAGIGCCVGHYWLSPLLEFVAPWVETAGLSVASTMLVGSGLVSVALPPAVGVARGLVIGEF